MIPDDTERVGQEVSEGYVRIFIPVHRKKVVKEQIDQHPAVMAEGFVDPSLALEKMAILSGKGIDAPVQFNPTLDTCGKTAGQPPLDEVSQEVTDHEIVVIA